MPSINLEESKQKELLDAVQACKEYYQDQYYSVIAMYRNNQLRHEKYIKIHNLANVGASFGDAKESKAFQSVNNGEVPFYTSIKRSNVFHEPDREYGITDLSFFNEMVTASYQSILKRIVGNFLYKNYSHYLPMTLVDYLDLDKIYDYKEVVLENLQTWWDDFIVKTNHPHADLKEYSEYINSVFAVINHKEHVQHVNEIFKEYALTDQFQNIEIKGDKSLKFPKTQFYSFQNNVREINDRVNALLVWMNLHYGTGINGVDDDGLPKPFILQLGSNELNLPSVNYIKIYKNNSFIINFASAKIMQNWVERLNKNCKFVDKKTL